MARQVLPEIAAGCVAYSSKLSSCYLLLIISYAMVALVNRPEAADDEAAGLARVSQ